LNIIQMSGIWKVGDTSFLPISHWLFQVSQACYLVSYFSTSFLML
jgi:hypothetical protein